MYFNNYRSFGGSILKFVIKVDTDGQFFLNGDMIDRRGCGWREDESHIWRYSREANIEDRLNLAIEFGEVGREKVNECKTYYDLYRLWEIVKEGKRISESFFSHPMYFDPADKRHEIIEKLEKKQSVNIAGKWYGSTICFADQMFDKNGQKITIRSARKFANQLGFIWLKKPEVGCVFMVTEKYNEANDLNKSAINNGCGVLSPLEFWSFVDEDKEIVDIEWDI